MMNVSDFSIAVIMILITIGMNRLVKQVDEIEENEIRSLKIAKTSISLTIIFALMLSLLYMMTYNFASRELRVFFLNFSGVIFLMSIEMLIKIDFKNSSSTNMLAYIATASLFVLVGILVVVYLGIDLPPPDSLVILIYIPFLLINSSYNVVRIILKKRKIRKVSGF